MYLLSYLQLGERLVQNLHACIISNEIIFCCEEFVVPNWSNWYLRRTRVRSMHSTGGVCICCLASNGYQFVRNDDVWRLTKHPKLTAIIQSRWLTLFVHIMRMDDNADAKRFLLASPLADWRRQLGHPHITWLSTIQQDLKQRHLRLTLPEAADLAQNRPLWRLMSTYGGTQS